MQKVPVSILSIATGVLVPQNAATVQVRDSYSGLNVTLYEDDETTPKANPAVADSSGLATFKVENGIYDFIVSDGLTTKTITKVKISDGAELILLTNGEGATIDFGKVCHIHTDGTAKISHNDQAELQARAQYICVTRGGLANGAIGVFSAPGRVAELSGGSAGVTAWLDVDGDLMTTALDPTDEANIGLFRTRVGEWLSTTVLDFNPSEPSEI